MKMRVFFGMAVLSLFFIGQVAAQDVNTVLQNKEKRQMLYASIINNDEMFREFMESTKACGRTDEGISTLNEELTGIEEALTNLEFEASENQLMMRQMVRLMKEFATRNAEFQKVINESYPEISQAMELEY